MPVEFQKTTPEEQQKLRRALDANALTGQPVKMDPATTSFILDDREVEESIINAIQSVPCHY